MLLVRVKDQAEEIISYLRIFNFENFHCGFNFADQNLPVKFTTGTLSLLFLKLGIKNCKHRNIGLYSM